MPWLFPIFDIAHALVVSDSQCQDGAHHGTSIRDVAVEQQYRIGNFHHLVLRIYEVDKCICILCEVVSGANIHIRSSRRLGCEVCRGCQVVIPGLGFHDVRHQHVLSSLQQILLREGQVCVPARLIQSFACHHVSSVGCWHSSCEGSCSCLLLPVERRRLHRRLARVAEFLLPAWINLVCIFLECQESTLEFLVRFCVLDDSVRQTHIAVHASLPEHPCLLALTARNCTLLGPILVSESATTGGQNDVGMAQVLKEGRQAKSVHATGNDWSCLNHTLPFLVVVGPVGLVLLQHVCDALVGCIPLHLAEAHGADMDAARPDDTGELGMYECGVSSLCLWASDSTVTSPVVVEELFGKVPARHGDSCATRHVTVHKEGAILRQRTKLGKNVLAACDHLCWIISRDIGRKQLCRTCLLDACP